MNDVVSHCTAPRYNHYPERILQIGEGNFLRAFADWMINSINANGSYQGSVVLCQPIVNGLADKINAQEGIYHVAMRGIEDGQPVERIETITSVSRCINPYQDYEAFLQIARSEDLQVVISNTTEAGIAYDPNAKLTGGVPSSFPAKVTALLYERYQAFHGAQDRGLLFLPVELIDNNGAELKRIVLRHAQEWGLGQDFINWIETANHFTSTLVDRIVTGYPRENIAAYDEKLGYHDDLFDTCELFNLWVIEGDPAWKDILPLHKGAGNVIWTSDVTPYKKRKVRVLNGGHTSTVLAAYLAGHDTVLDFMNDPLFRGYLDDVLYQEVLPTLDLPKDELLSFAMAVGDRFSNPYIRHKLLDISLNSCSKFNARCLPTLLAYHEQFGKLPEHMTFALAAFIRFYKVTETENGYAGHRKGGEAYPVRDDAGVLRFFCETWKSGDPAAVAHAALANTAFWSGRDLTAVPGLEQAVASYLNQMETQDMREVVASLKQ